jgi:hypothetical protein
VRPARRLVKTELVLPETRSGKAAVLAGLVVGGAVALAMVALVSIFLFETFRGRT